MLSNAYFLAKFRFGTAKNEPAKNLQFEILQKTIAKFVNFANPNSRKPRTQRRRRAQRLTSWLAEVLAYERPAGLLGEGSWQDRVRILANFAKSDQSCQSNYVNQILADLSFFGKF